MTPAGTVDQKAFKLSTFEKLRCLKTSRGGMQVVICGGGVIGACTAYLLGRLGSEVIVVETAEVAAAASSTAGGSPALN